MSTVLRIEYTGSEASCILTANPAAKTLSSSIGDAGAESADTAFGTAGVLDLTDLEASDVVDAIDDLTDYTAEILEGYETASAWKLLQATMQAKTTAALLTIGPNPDALVSWATARIYLGTTSDPLADEDQLYTEGLINAASTRANAISGRLLAQRTQTIILDGPGGEIVVLPQFPVASITEVRIDTLRAFGSDTIVAATDYDFYEDGRLWVTIGTPEARRSIQVTYTAGFDPVPDDLQIAVIESIAYSWKRLQSRSIGTQSITADGVTTQFEIDIPMPARRIFESYRDFRRHA